MTKIHHHPSGFKASSFAKVRKPVAKVKISAEESRKIAEKLKAFIEARS